MANAMQCTVLPHITASVFLNDDEHGLHQGYEKLQEGLAPHPWPRPIELTNCSSARLCGQGASRRLRIASVSGCGSVRRRLDSLEGMGLIRKSLLPGVSFKAPHPARPIQNEAFSTPTSLCQPYSCARSPFQGLLHAPALVLVDQVDPAGRHAYHQVECLGLHR
jgi:hypothetical protein